MNEIQEKTSKEFGLLAILANQRTAQKLLHYLSTEDVHNLMICDKKVYQAFKNPLTYIYDKYMFKKYKDDYIYFYKNNFQLKHKEQIKDVIISSDSKYKSLYYKSNIIVIIYYFSGCVLLLDIFVLMVMIDKSVNHFDDFLPQIPLVIFWFLSIMIIISIYLLEYLTEKSVKNEFYSKNIVNENYEIPENILKSIYKRLCNMKQTSYRAFALTYIFCYIPIIFKIIFSKFSYAAAFLCMSSIFCICGLFYDIGKYFYYRSLHFVTKYNIYENIYKDIDPEYFRNKMNNIFIGNNYQNVGEIRLSFLYYFWLAVFHGLFLFYAFLIGKKLDDINFTVSWRILLIPLYIACAIIVLWGLVYIFSIKQDKTKYRWILIITIVIIMICAIVNCVFWPNFYNNKKNITRFFPIVIDGLITIFSILHYIFLRLSRKEYINEMDINSFYIL